MNYQQAYDKIIQAYFKDEIEPFDPTFCFCGTLCGDSGWSEYWNKTPVHRNYRGYSSEDYVRMERALLMPISEGTETSITDPKVWFTPSRSAPLMLKSELPDYEERLFDGMSTALEVLKDIHRSRGEDVDAITVPFTKRQLA